MKIENNTYNIDTDLCLYIIAAHKTNDEIAKDFKISKSIIYKIFHENKCHDVDLEKIYSKIYTLGYFTNKEKSNVLKETRKNLVLFHGSKYGLDNIDEFGSRKTCDFGTGFYLGESYFQAASFVCDIEKSSVYSFECDINNLNVVSLDISLEWIISICYFRGYLKEYEDRKYIKDLVKKFENADIIIAPIADNKMFYIMSLFTQGEINVDVACESLAASRLGNQYVFKSKKAINNLKMIERYYLSNAERDDIIKSLNERSYVVDNILNKAKREYRDGLYIEEILK